MTSYAILLAISLCIHPLEADAFQEPLPVVGGKPLEPVNGGIRKDSGLKYNGFDKPVKSPLIIANSPECSMTVKQLCSSTILNNNFAVLECLQNEDPQNANKVQEINKECQNYIWNYKRNLTKDIRFDAAAGEVCKDALETIPECKGIANGQGMVISCLVEYQENITSTSCRQFLRKMNKIVFSDYQLVYKFAEACETSITNLQCGRVSEDQDKLHSQGRTIDCLEEHVSELDGPCRLQILRIAELQADDFHLDRALFYACRDDREKFCSKVKSGGGKVYKCLYKHKFERDMSDECREKLTRRQNLMQQDYKVNKGLSDACQHDIKQYKCLKDNNLPRERHGKLAHILICLEEYMNEGKKKKVPTATLR